MLKLSGKIIKPTYFPDGTLSLRVDVPDEKKLTITWCFDSNEEMSSLFYLVNHIRSKNLSADISLLMPYIPNARMDRVKNPDEVFSLKFFAQFINSLGFSEVVVCDPHSEVSCALIDNIKLLPHMPYIEDVMIRTGFDKEKDVVFYPDAGCAKKYESLMVLPYLKGDKKRDWRSGKIVGLDVLGDIPSLPFRVLIVDDICSKGGTFCHSAKKLVEAGAKEIYLYITHCENTILEGELIKSGLITRIYTTDSVFTKEHSLIELVKSFRQEGE
jgi:ribose-phosphate pyrophosphokinase